MSDKKQLSDEELLAPRPDSVSIALGRLSQMDWRAIGVTALAICLYMFASHIPWPLLDLPPSGSSSWQSINQTSIMALGVAPWFGALVFVELLGTLIPPLRKRLGFYKEHANPFSRTVIVFALLFGASHAYQIVYGNSFVGMVDMEDRLSVALICFSMIGGLVLTILIGKLIETRGMGNGFWLLFGFEFLSNFGTSWFWLVQLLEADDPIFFVSLVLTIGLVLAMVSLIVYVTLAAKKHDILTPAPFVLPWHMAYNFVGLLISIVFFNAVVLDFVTGNSDYWDYALVTLIVQVFESDIAKLFHFQNFFVTAVGIAILGLPFLLLGLRRHGALRLFGFGAIVLTFVFLPSFIELLANEFELFIWTYILPGAAGISLISGLTLFLSNQSVLFEKDSAQ